MDQIKMGKFISELRKEKKLTQKDIGDKLGISDNSVSKWERGINTPDIYYLTPLSELFNVTVKELLNGEKNIKKTNKSYQNKNKILEINNVTTKLGNKVILNDVNLDIYAGEIVGLIGPNGAGKSTLIKTILSIFKKENGNIKINGYDTDKNYELSMENIGAIIETPEFYNNISALKNLKISATLLKVKDKDIISELVNTVNLENRQNEKVKTYSLGMKQRLAIANSLLNNPKLLILDEPTNGLDPLAIKELRNLLKKLSDEKETSILISSHILSELENICNRVFIIDKGKIIGKFEIDSIKNNDLTLEDKFINCIKENK